MCFLVLEHEHKPMKVRGERVSAATVIPLHENALFPGTYISAQSGGCVEVKSIGFLADAAPEARPVYAAMRAIGVTLDENGSNATEGAVYLPLDCPYTVQAFHGTLTAVNPHVDLSNYWLPARFDANGVQAEGWFRISGAQGSDLRIVSGSLKEADTVQVKLLNVKNVAWSVEQLERTDGTYRGVGYVGTHTPLRT